jgi:hypothetical protein
VWCYLQTANGHRTKFYIIRTFPSSALPMSSHEKHEVDIENIDLFDDSGELSELAVVAEGEERTTWFVWILVSCSTISGLLFGMCPAPPSPPRSPSSLQATIPASSLVPWSR